MSSSLQEQLLKTGLVTEEQLEDARRKETRGRGGGRGPRDARTDGQSKDGGARGKGRGRGPGKGRGKPRRTREAGQSKPADGQAAAADTPAAPGTRRRAPLDKKRLRQRVRALLEKRVLNVENGDIPYNFVRGKRVKRLYVDESLRARLVGGELLIAEVYGLHHILDEAGLAAVVELLPETFVHRHGDDAGATAEEGSVPDEYAGFEVPDDLVW